MSDLHTIHGRRDLGVPRRPSRMPVTMDLDTLGRLADAALAEGVTPSEWAERAIEERLSREGIAPGDAVEAPEPRQGPEPGPEPPDSRPGDDAFSRGLLGRQAGRPTDEGGDAR